MWGVSYWIVPLFSAVVWLAMLLALLLTWVHDGKPHLPSMERTQTIAYISDVGATDLKPLFIAMSAVTVVTLDLAFIFERWLRHKGRLVHNTSMLQKVLSIISIVFAIAGAAGLILLSIFDTLHHNRLHNTFLAIFIGGYVLSAVFTCWEYQRLGMHFREHKILRASFWIKLIFIIVEVALAIAFGVTQQTGRRNTAAILEWVIALVYTFYVLSFFVDFIPAVRTKHHQSHETAVDMAYQDAEAHPLSQPATNGRFYENHSSPGSANGYTNGHASNGFGNGIVNGHTGIGGDTYLPDGHPKLEVPPSRNF